MQESSPLTQGRATSDGGGVKLSVQAWTSQWDVREKLFHLEVGCRCGTWAPHRASSELESWDGAVDEGMG